MSEFTWIRAQAGRVRRLLRRGRFLATPPNHLSPSQRWVRDGGNQRRLKGLELRSDDHVLDFGGYLGDYAADVRRLYSCFVHVFEPVPAYSDAISARFRSDEKVRVHPYAIGLVEGNLQLHMSEDATGEFAQGAAINGSVRAAEWLALELPDEIGLAKLNIEGGEYSLIPALYHSGLLSRIKRVIIQFHDVVPESAERRLVCQELLTKSHACDWDYPFVWESWTRR